VDIQRQIAAVMRKQQNAPGATDLQVLVAPSVMERLRNEDEQMLVEMQRRYSGKLTFKSEVARHPESFAILDRDGKVLYAVSENRSV
jgi:ribonuclease G